MGYESEKYIDGSDRAIRQLIKQHNNLVHANNKAASKTQKKGIDNFRTRAANLPLFRKGRAHANDIKQLGIGNCYFLSALLALVQRDPTYIEDMITQRADGSVMVRLWDIKLDERGERISTPVYYHLNNTFVRTLIPNWHKAGWVFLIEKAYYLHRLRHSDEKLQHKAAEGRWRYRDVLTAGHASQSFEHLTGISSSIQLIKKPTHPLDQLLLAEGAIDLYNQVDDEMIRHNIIQNMYFSEGGDILEKWQTYLGDTLTQTLKASFPPNAYPSLVQLFTSIKQKNLSDAQAVTKKIWPGLTNEEVDVVVSGLMRSHDELNLIKQSLADTLRQSLHQQLQAGNLVCPGSIHDKQALKGTGLIEGHAYHLLNIYKRDNKWVVLLENPWGRSTPKQRFLAGNITHEAITVTDEMQQLYHARGGTFELSMTTFLDGFDSYDVTKLDAHTSDLEEAVITANEELRVSLAKEQKFLEQWYNTQQQAELLQDDTHITQHNIEQLSHIITQLKEKAELTSDENTLLKTLSAKHTAYMSKPDDASSSDADSGIFDTDLPDATQLHALTEAAADDREYQYQATQRLAWQTRHTSKLATNLGAEGHANKHHDYTQENSRSELLINLKVKLLSYLGNTHTQKDIKAKSLVNRMHYRLFYRGEDRQVSRQHKNRANTLLAFIDTWHHAESPEDKQTLEAMMLALQDHHKNSSTTTSCFHGNRLSQKMQALNKLTLKQKNYRTTPLKHLSPSAASTLQQCLRQQGLNPVVRDDIFYNDLNFKTESPDPLTDDPALSAYLKP